MFAAVLVGRARGEALTGWQVGFLVFGTLLLLGSFLQLINAANGTPQDSLNLLWTFGISAGVAAATSLALRAPFQMLLGALLALVAWLALWDKVLSNPSGDTVRWLLLVLAAIYLGVAVVLMRSGRPQASDLVTAAGIAAVLAAALSFAGAAGAVSNTFGSALSGSAPKPGQGWNIFLLVVSLALIAYESRSPTRGPGYVGTLGLLSFIGLTGLDLVNRLNGDDAGGVVGWPLVLLLVGGAALVASFVMPAGEGPGGGGAPGASAGPGPGGGGVVTQPGAAGDQLTAPRQVLPEPGAPLPPPGAGQPGQQGTPLDHWRQQPPPGAGPPPQQ
jgi:hypothetical protein